VLRRQPIVFGVKFDSLRGSRQQVFGRIESDPFTILIFFVYLAMLRASKINERAWVVPVIQPIQATTNPMEFQANVHLINNGKTPAWIMAAGSKGQAITNDKTLPGTASYDEMKPFNEKGQLLSPTGFLIQGFTLDKTRLDLVRIGNLQLFIYGYARYRDVYGDSHIVRYCFQAQKSQDPNHPHPVEFYVGGPKSYWEAD